MAPHVMRTLLIVPCFVLLAGGLQGPSQENTRTSTDHKMLRVMKTISCTRNKNFRETEPGMLAKDTSQHSEQSAGRDARHHVSAVSRKNIWQSEIPEVLRGGSVCAQASSSTPFFHWVSVSIMLRYALAVRKILTHTHASTCTHFGDKLQCALRHARAYTGIHTTAR
jgi:hypothetical protein